MLGADRAIHLRHDVVDDAVHLLALGGEGRPVPVFRGNRVVVDVAIADMAEAAGADAGIGLLQRQIGALDEFGDARQRHRDIVLDADAGQLLRLSQLLADRPQLLRLVAGGGNHRIGYQLLLDGLGQRFLQRLLQRARGTLPRHLGQHIPGMDFGQRVVMAVQRVENEIETAALQQLETGDLLAQPAAHQPQQLHRRIGVGHGDEGGLALARLREQPQHGRRDDADGALAADEQLLHVEAGIVLAQAAQTVPDAPVGQHHLQPQHEVAGIAVAQHLGAAGIGREVAADLAGAFRPQAQREQPVDLRRLVLDRGQHHAGLYRHGVVQRIDSTDAIHPGGGDHHLQPARMRLPAAGQAGIAALRHDRHAGCRAELHDLRDLPGRGRAQHQWRVAAPAIAPGHAIGLHIGRVVDIAGRADDFLQAIQDVGIQLGHALAFVIGGIGSSARGCSGGL